jgi:hypothetical protein
MRWERLRRLVRAILRFELVRPRFAAVAPLSLAALLSGVLAGVLAAALAGCMGAMTPRGKLDDAVQEVNMAVRFGRSDIAAERVLPAARPAFLKRHKAWGGDVRVVDIEYGGVEKITETEAVILVGFGWFRPSDGVLRSTTVRQTWRNDKGTGPWFLFDEQHAGGDVGLLGEQVEAAAPGPKKNAQFETTVIR